MSGAVGIDLGTTFSAIATVDEHGQAYAIPNAEGMLSTPSIVLWHEGSFLVGQPALDMIIRAGEKERTQLEAGLIRGIKRMIGRPPPGGLFTNGRRTDPVEISSAILSKLASDASAHLGFKVQDVVITVPAHFVDFERSATRTAAEMAGLRVLQMINEPSAAALAYTRGKTTTQETILVFDLGGGTFDTTILQLQAHEARVLSTKGIEELGGIQFTTSLSRILRRRYEQETLRPFPNDSLANALLLALAESTKCRLSSTSEVEVYIAPKMGQPAKVMVTQPQFTAQINLLLVQLEDAVEQVLRGAKKTPREIDRVLLCGGSSRIPAVQKMLAHVFSRQPEAILDLDLSVALGAAYQAAAYRHNPHTEEIGFQLLPDESHLVDCVSYAVGIAVKDPRGNATKLVMLHAGDPLEAWSQPFELIIQTSTNSFPPVRLYTGEENAQLQEYLGYIAVSLPPGVQPGTKARVTMLQDRSGFVQIKLTIGGKEVSGYLQRDR